MYSTEAILIFISSCVLCIVNAQKTGQITVLTEPVVEFAGESGVLNCTVSSPPGARNDIRVQWNFLNGTSGSKTISQDCSITEDNNDDADGEKKYELSCFPSSNNMLYSLKINSLSVPDYGTYECTTSVVGETDTTDRMPVRLTVLSPPKMTFAASDLVADAYLGQNVSLKCMAEGVPAPNVTWGRNNGKPLPGDGRSFTVKSFATAIRTTQTLYLLNLTKEDRGTYRCSADNSVRPPDEMFSKLSIEFAPTVSPVEPSYGTPTGENTQAMMWCQVDGNPRPVMSWYAMSKEESQQYADGRLELNNDFFANAFPILSDEKYKVEQKIMTVGSLSTMDSMFYSLTLKTVEAIDLVYYVCRAENTHGDGAVAIELYRVNKLADERSLASTITATLFTMLLSNLLTRL